MKLRDFDIICPVGGGRFGTVYKAKNKKNGKVYAIKLLHKKFSDDERFLGVFHRELFTISGIRHKNIVKFFGSCFEPPVCYIITEFIDGISLNQIIRKGIKLPPIVAISIITEILKGLDYLHLHDIIHADLSSSNILVSKTGRVLLADLGLAIHEELEHSNFTQGTPGYFSPEHITNVPITKRSDLYCVGIIFYELLTGISLFPPTNNKNKIYAYMGDLNFDKIQGDSFFQKIRLKKFLKKCLSFREPSRVSDAETAFYILNPILKARKVNFTRKVINNYFSRTELWKKFLRKKTIPIPFKKV